MIYQYDSILKKKIYEKLETNSKLTHLKIIYIKLLPVGGVCVLKMSFLTTKKSKRNKYF